MLTFRSGENVESDQHGVVEEQHDRSELEGGSGEPGEEERSNITYIDCFRMLYVSILDRDRWSGERTFMQNFQRM